MDHEEEERAVELLQRSASAYQRLVRRADDAAWSRKPAAGRWSLAETAEHVTLVERSTAKLFRKRLFAEPAPAELLAAAAGKDELMRTWQEDRTPRTAPDFVAPRGAWPGRLETLAVFLEERESVITSIRNAPAGLRRFGALHPVLGPLDAYQWALFLGYHLERHIRQMEEMVSESEDQGVR
jgi:hypothetical protein